MKLEPGDRAQVEALRIVEEWLKRQGWKFSPDDVGKRARDILSAMTSEAGRTALDKGGRDG